MGAFIRLLGMLVLALQLVGTQASAQGEPLNFLSIERPPFAYVEDGVPSGFSIELMLLIGNELGREVSFKFVDEFPAMLDSVVNGEEDGAIANISITSAREAVLDFSRPIYASGLKILVSGDATSVSIWDVVLRWELLAWVGAAFGALFVLGMLMWALERRQQSYFDQSAREAMFPSFWWALNLVLNGGFEVNVPRTVLGRLLGVFMVVSSLFVVSLFVANITAALTVEAISGNIQSIDDLKGRSVGTTAGSTASQFLEDEDVAHTEFATFQDLMRSFEAGQLDAVVFDGPILAHYQKHNLKIEAQLLERLFRAEDYGIALSQGSSLREPINRALLRLQENGRYEALRSEWFGDRR